MKVVINTCFGGFGLSQKAFQRMIELGFPTENSDDLCICAEEPHYCYNLRNDKYRNHPILVQVVEELGPEASDRFAKLVVVEIPDDVKYHIHEYDGMEHVAENHNTWA